MDANGLLEHLQVWNKLCNGCLRVHSVALATHTVWIAKVSIYCQFAKQEIDARAYGLDREGAMLNLARKLEDVLKNRAFLKAKKALDRA